VRGGGGGLALLLLLLVLLGEMGEGGWREDGRWEIEDG